MPVCAHRLGLISCLLLGGLAGCATQVPTHTSRTEPAAAITAASAPDATAPSPWWRHFDDPQLGALIDDALAHNLDIAQAQERIRQVRATRDLSTAALAPTLGLGASGTHSRNQLGSSTSQRLGLDASWEPDLFGSQGATRRGAELDLAAAQASAAGTRQAVAAEVALAYIQLRGSRHQLGIAQQNLQAQQQTQDLTRWRAEAGLGSTLDAEQARASTEQLRASLPVLQASIANSEHRLGVLLGQAPAALRERLGASDRIPALTAVLPPGVPADLLRRRPDLQAAELNVRAELARLDSAQAARWPTFSLSGSLALQAATLAGLSSSGAWLVTLGAALNWPLLDGGSRAARIEAQDAVSAQTRLAYQAAVLGALEDVENALANVEGTQRQAEALGRATEAARNAQALATHRYQAGLIDFGTLLDAQRTLLSLQNALAGAQTQQSLYLVQLGKALGGDWSEAAGADADASTPKTR